MCSNNWRYYSFSVHIIPARAQLCTPTTLFLHIPNQVRILNGTVVVSVCLYDKTSQSRPIYFGLFWLRISVHGHLVLSFLGQSVMRQSITEVLNSTPGQSCSLQNSQETENKQTNKSKQIFNTGALGTILYLNHRLAFQLKCRYLLAVLYLPIWIWSIK